MKILLPIDDSEYSEAALRTVIRQFSRRMRKYVSFMWTSGRKGMPVSLAFAEGPESAPHILAVHEEGRRRSREILDATPRADVAVTLQCVECHRYLARARIAPR